MAQREQHSDEATCDKFRGAFPGIYCPGCHDIKPMVFDLMCASELNDHDAVDLMCGDCRLVIATIHGTPQ